MDLSLHSREHSVFFRYFKFVVSELAPYPGRKEVVARQVLSCCIVILIAMTLQVPFLGSSLTLVFFTAQENTQLTLKSGIGLIIGISLAVVVSITMIKLTLEFPLERILFASAIVFCGMYFMRASKLGSIGYIVAFIVIYMQSLVDVVNDPETLTRLILWVWLSGIYPVIVTILVNLLFLPVNALDVFHREMLRQISEVEILLRARIDGAGYPRTGADIVTRDSLALRNRLAYAATENGVVQKQRDRYMLRVNTVDRLRIAAAYLSNFPALEISGSQKFVAGKIIQALSALKVSITEEVPFELADTLRFSVEHEDGAEVTLYEMAHAIQSLADSETEAVLESHILPGPKEAPQKGDMFGNPTYIKFALKALLAALICYVFYTATKWPGIHTSMLTCIIMALPSVGATSHKGILRLAGCALGSLVTLLAVVFVVPKLEDITGLLCLTLPIVACGSWIAAGSARVNYIGVQFIIAYSLELFGQFGPTTDLVEIRDRFIGIMIGAVVSVCVFGFIWPEREGAAFRKMLGGLFACVADLLLAGVERDGAKIDRSRIFEIRRQGLSLLTANKEIQARIALEPGWQYSRDSVNLETQTWLAEAQSALVSVNWLQTTLLHFRASLSPSMQNAIDNFQEAAAASLEALSRNIDGEHAGNDDMLKLRLEEVYQRCQEAGDKGLSKKIVDEVRASVLAIKDSIMRIDCGPGPGR